VFLISIKEEVELFKDSNAKSLKSNNYTFSTENNPELVPEKLRFVMFNLETVIP